MLSLLQWYLQAAEMYAYVPDRCLTGASRRTRLYDELGCSRRAGTGIPDGRFLALNPLTLSGPTCVPPAKHCHPRGNMTSIPPIPPQPGLVAQPSSVEQERPPRRPPSTYIFCGRAATGPMTVAYSIRPRLSSRILPTASHSPSLLQLSSTWLRLTQSLLRINNELVLSTPFPTSASRTTSTAHHDVLLRHLPRLPCHSIPTLAW